MSMAVCSVPGCQRVVDSRGWCFAHYQRWYLNGDVQADKPLQRIRQATTLKPLTPTELGWLAGWLEGEGCFCPSNNHGYRRVTISAKSIDHDVIKYVHTLTGVGTVSFTRCVGRNDIWTWQVRVREDVTALASAILPLMHSRRHKRISEVLAWDVPFLKYEAL